MTTTDLAQTLHAIPEDALAAWISTQRWFGSKSRDTTQFHVMESIPVRVEQPALAVVLVEARFRPGTHDVYQVLAGVRPAAASIERGEIHRDGERVIYDALLDPEQAAEIGRLLGEQATIETECSTLRFFWTGECERLAAHPQVRVMSAEQSNTSLVFDERLIMKAFRRVEPGINPELEMLRFLSRRGFEHVARLSGWYELSGELMDATLGVVQRFIPASEDGWELALRSVRERDESFLAQLRELGVVTGRLHSALASDPTDPDFSPEEPGDETVSLLIATIDEQVERMFLDLPDLSDLDPIAGRGEEVRDLLSMMAQASVGGRLIRNHGDYHLGQTVLGPEGWFILDFEGEPGRPLIERRRKRSPLRDVAGMMRSFAYAASASTILFGGEPDPGWEAAAREAFLDGYLAEVDPSLLPAGAAGIHRMIAIFELEKAIYELRYELNNRPHWVSVPVAGIARLLEEALT